MTIRVESKANLWEMYVTIRRQSKIDETGFVLDFFSFINDIWLSYILRTFDKGILSLKKFLKSERQSMRGNSEEDDKI